MTAREALKRIMEITEDPDDYEEALIDAYRLACETLCQEETAADLLALADRLRASGKAGYIGLDIRDKPPRKRWMTR